MLCKTCNISDICRIREFLSSNSHIVEAPVTRCIHKNQTAVADFPMESLKPEAFGIGVTKQRDFSEASRKASGVDPNKDFKLITPDNGEEFTTLVNCPSCEGKTPVDGITECDDCGIAVCGCCLTLDNDTGKILCPECWSKLK